jgi:hypothetical protein
VGSCLDTPWTLSLASSLSLEKVLGGELPSFAHSEPPPTPHRLTEAQDRVCLPSTEGFPGTGSMFTMRGVKEQF